jgi:hypothetical protein
MHRPKTGLVLWLLCLASFGCSEELSQRPKTSLIDHQRWSKTAVSTDPFLSMKPVDAQCGDGAFTIEDGVVEVDTGVCDFLTLEQPSLEVVGAGDSLEVILWHLTLVSLDGEAANGYAAVAIGGDVVWEIKVPIPSKEGFYQHRKTAPRRFEESTPIHLHIHNHGTNTWKLLSVSVGG